MGLNLKNKKLMCFTHQRKKGPSTGEGGQVAQEQVQQGLHVARHTSHVTRYTSHVTRYRQACLVASGAVREAAKAQVDTGDVLRVMRGV